MSCLSCKTNRYLINIYKSQQRVTVPQPLPIPSFPALLPPPRSPEVCIVTRESRSDENLGGSISSCPVGNSSKVNEEGSAGLPEFWLCHIYGTEGSICQYLQSRSVLKGERSVLLFCMLSSQIIFGLEYCLLVFL